MADQNLIVICVKSATAGDARTLWDVVVILPDNQRVVVSAYSNPTQPHPRDIIEAARARARTDHFKAKIRDALLALDVDDLPPVDVRFLAGAPGVATC